MRAVVIGVRATARYLAAQLEDLGRAEGVIRVFGGRTWAALPFDCPDEQVEALVGTLGTVVRIAVEMPLGLRGHDLQASRCVIPGDDMNLTGVVVEWLHEMLQDSGGGFDEDVTALEFAWELAREVPAVTGPLLDGTPDERWAAALVDALVRGGRTWLAVTGDLRSDLERALPQTHPDDISLGEAVLDALKASAAVEDVFTDAATLAEVAEAAYPDEDE